MEQLTELTAALGTALQGAAAAVADAVSRLSGEQGAAAAGAAGVAATTVEQRGERPGTYKATHTLQQRMSEYHAFRRTTATGRVHVLLETPAARQRKLSVRADLRFGEFVYLVRKRRLPQLPASRAVWCLVGVEHELPHVAMTMAQVHARHVDFDGWLYVVVREETTFGRPATPGARHG